MQISRRGFSKTIILAGVSFSGFYLAGCDVPAEIGAWVLEGKSAFANIVALLARDGVIVPVAAVSTTNAALDAVTAAVNAYEADKSKGQAVIASAIDAAIAAINAFLSLPAVQASPQLALALSLADIILSTLEGFLLKLPVVSNPAAARVNAGLHQKPRPERRSPAKFKSDWNAAAKAGGHPELVL